MSERKKTILLSAACALFLLLGVAYAVWPSERTEAEQETAQVGPMCHFVTPEGEYSLASGPDGSLVLPEADAPEKQVFLGWEDEDGLRYAPGEVTVTNDLSLSAVYGVDMVRDRHPAYLFPDDAGRCRANFPITQSEAVGMIYALLAEKPETDGTPESEAEALASLGVLEKEAFDAERSLTLAELLEMLSHFYPPARGGAAFCDLDADDAAYASFSLATEHGWIESGDDVPAAANRVLTRLETARIMNLVLARGEAPGEYLDAAQALCDLPEREEDRLTMLEAVVTHEFEERGGRLYWTSAETPVTLIPGFSSGDWVLDKLLAEILEEQLGEETRQTEQLRLLYRYVRDSFRYRKGRIYEMGDTSWLTEEAKKLASTGRGNCYSYAALLCELYRAVGVDAEIYSGRIAGSPHAWVEAEIDGDRYIFDVEMEYSYRHQPNKGNVDMFMKTYEEMTRWRYESPGR